jgi:hypothetical protein
MSLKLFNTLPKSIMAKREKIKAFRILDLRSKPIVEAAFGLDDGKAW